MKGNEKIIAKLNELLADELSAISQYMVHSEMCADWGYEKLHAAVEKRAIDEMKHAEKLIGRIIFLEGTPIVSELNPLHIGAKVPDQEKMTMLPRSAPSRATTMASAWRSRWAITAPAS